MRFSTNITEMYQIKELPDYVFVGEKWRCKYLVETPAGTKVYFSNIKKSSDIYNMQFTAAAMIRSEDTYVLTPDTLGMDRASILIGIDIGDTEVLSTQQACLFDFYHYNSEKHQIIALARDFPEVYCGMVTLLKVNVAKNSSDAIRETGYYYATSQAEVNYERYPSYAEYCELSLASSGSFIMHGQYIRRRDGSYYLRPATKFVINRDNIIIVNNYLEMIDIWDFLHNSKIPSDVSIIWANPDLAEEALERFLSNATRYYNYIFIGYDYNRTIQLRTKAMVHNCKVVSQ